MLPTVSFRRATGQSYAVPEAAHASPPSSVSDAQMFALAHSHYENFSVLSVLVPQALRKPFAHVYWFCRTADDIADEHDGSELARLTALKRLQTFRSLFESSLKEHSAATIEPAPFSRLACSIKKHHLDQALFHQLLDAFEQDQTVVRYSSLQQLLEYCTLSANPVGRIVLQLGGLNIADAANAHIVAKSDAICTALQLVNHCQDIRRDLLERNRIYIPLPSAVDESSLKQRATSQTSEMLEHTPVQAALRPVIQHSRLLFESARDLPRVLPPSIAATVHLMIAGGLQIQSLVETRQGTLFRQRPSVSKLAQLRLLCHSILWKTMLRLQSR